MCDESCSRRRFLARAAALAAGGVLAGCGAPSAKSLLNGGEAQELELSMSDYPALENVGGAAVTNAGPHGTKMIVFRRSESEVVAVSPICPHQQCIVSYTGDLGGTCFVCPCHGSAFGAEGDLRRGPATQGLTRFPAVLESDKIVVKI
jgi:Rieske Fe-S protein